jgi:hypothetical protein
MSLAVDPFFVPHAEIEGNSMATTAPVLDIAAIGETAGAIWQILSEDGPMTVAKLVKAASEPRDTVMQAIGWLAREDKLTIVQQGRNHVVSLR